MGANIGLGVEHRPRARVYPTIGCVFCLQSFTYRGNSLKICIFRVKAKSLSCLHSLSPMRFSRGEGLPRSHSPAFTPIYLISNHIRAAVKAMKAKSKTYSVVYAHTRAKNDDGTDDSERPFPRVRPRTSQFCQVAAETTSDLKKSTSELRKFSSEVDFSFSYFFAWEKYRGVSGKGDHSPARGVLGRCLETFTHK